MLYSFTIFVSAFLLFQVQLVIAKQLLPWFGGAPAVWTTCQVFFQVLLLAGYAYAHAIGLERNRKRQVLFHVLVIVCAFAPLLMVWLDAGTPLLPPAMMKPEGDVEPVPRLLGILVLCVGFPFFALSATSPLLQRWHSWTEPSLDRTYRLYGLSNAGSLLGLVSYPFGVERLLDLPQQAWEWSVLFLAFAIACAGIAMRAMRTAAPNNPAREKIPSAPAEEVWETRPVISSAIFWVLLSFSGSAMLLATTNRLCEDVASIPFLWMLPLALYLLTFIICFDRPHWYARPWMMAAAAIATQAVLAMSDRALQTMLVWQLVAFGAFLFLFCMVCHGELARLRPGRRHLTLYYLAIATGGALGGSFVSFVAPVVFHDFWEFNITILLGWCLFGAAWLIDRSSPFYRGHRVLFLVLLAGVVFTGLRFLLEREWLRDALGLEGGGGILASSLAANAALALALLAWRRRFVRWRGWAVMLVAAAIALSAVGLVRFGEANRATGTVSARTFYGVSKIRIRYDDDGRRLIQLIHGNINHGVQIDDDALRQTPTTYYIPSSGVGLAARFLEQRLHPREDDDDRGVHFGVLGLGTGTMAAYAQPGDSVRFYEINPLVIGLSTIDNPVFTFLRDCRGETSIARGDARLSLESEIAAGDPQLFDLLVLDVFSSDAIPVHLLTSEAFDLYVRRLRNDDAIIAVHISNRFLDLEPVVAAQARRLGLHAMLFDNPPAEPAGYSSRWILLVRNPRFFEETEVAAANPRPLFDREVLFTDRYSNLFQILH